MPAHQHAEEVYQGGKHLRLREWSTDDVAEYEERLRYFEGDHVFVGGEGVEGAEEQEGEEAEEKEGVEAEENEVEETEEEEGGEAEDEEGEEQEEEERKAPVDMEPELSIEVDVNPPPQPPAPRPKPSPKGAGAVPPPKTSPEAHSRHGCPPQTSCQGCRTPEALAGVQVWGEEGVGGECEPWHAPRGPGCVLHPGEVGGPAPPPDLLDLSMRTSRTPSTALAMRRSCCNRCRW